MSYTLQPKARISKSATAEEQALDRLSRYCELHELSVVTVMEGERTSVTISDGDTIIGECSSTSLVYSVNTAIMQADISFFAAIHSAKAA